MPAGCPEQGRAGPACLAAPWHQFRFIGSHVSRKPRSARPQPRQSPAASVLGPRSASSLTSAARLQAVCRLAHAAQGFSSAVPAGSRSSTRSAASSAAAEGPAPFWASSRGLGAGCLASGVGCCACCACCACACAASVWFGGVNGPHDASPGLGAVLRRQAERDQAGLWTLHAPCGLLRYAWRQPGFRWASLWVSLGF